jgi:hypothetical protein
MSRIVIVTLIRHRRKPTDSINLFDLYRRHDAFSVRIMSRIVIVILIYHCHKPTDMINLLDLYGRHDVLP